MANWDTLKAHQHKNHITGGRAKDSSSYAPAHTEDDEVIASYDITTGGLLVQNVGGGVIGVTEYTENGAKAANAVGGIVLLVRQDTLANLANDDGDLTVPKVNVDGAQYVQQADLDAAIDDVTIVPSGAALTDGSGTIAVNATSQEVFAANADRKYLFIQNVSSEELWINFTTDATAGQPSISLVPRATFCMESSFVSTEAVNIIGATAGSSFVAKEA